MLRRCKGLCQRASSRTLPRLCRASDGWLTVDLFSTAGTADATSLPEEGLPKDASKVRDAFFVLGCHPQ